MLILNKSYVDLSKRLYFRCGKLFHFLQSGCLIQRTAIKTDVATQRVLKISIRFFQFHVFNPDISK